MPAATKSSLPGFHPGYNDSAADLVIECKDGIKLRVHSYFLKAHSDYFRHMPSPSESPAGNTTKLVHLDCQANDVALLLGLVESGGAKSCSWEELKRVLILGERYQFQHTASFVRQPATHCISYSTVKEIFRFAASNKFHDLAKLAIVGFGDSDVSYNKYDDLPLELVKGIPGEFAASLIVAMAKHQPANDVRPAIRWQRISGSYNSVIE